MLVTLTKNDQINKLEDLNRLGIVLFALPSKLLKITDLVDKFDCKNVMGYYPT